MSHKMLIPFIVKVSVLGYSPLIMSHFDTSKSLKVNISNAECIRFYIL